MNKNIMDITDALNYQENYICYRCHSRLLVENLLDGQAMVYCPNPECNCTTFVKNDRLSQIVSANESKELTKNYVCSRCWGGLIAVDNHDGNFRVACGNQNCNGAGFVTQRYKDQRTSEASGEYMEANINLAETLGLRKRKTVEEIMRELGY